MTTTHDHPKHPNPTPPTTTPEWVTHRDETVGYPPRKPDIVGSVPKTIVAPALIAPRMRRHAQREVVRCGHRHQIHIVTVRPHSSALAV